MPLGLRKAEKTNAKMSALLTQFLMVRMSCFFIAACFVSISGHCLVVSVFSGHLSSTVFKCRLLSTQPHNADRLASISYHSRARPQLADGHTLQLRKVPANLWNKLQFRYLRMTLIHQYFAKFDCVNFIDPEY